LKTINNDLYLVSINAPVFIVHLLSEHLMLKKLSVLACSLLI